LEKETGKMDAILILDFGGQYCHLIGRRIREHGVYTEIIPYDISPEEVMALEKDLNARGIILSGGPSSVYEKNAPRCDPKVFDLGIPILGLCYGHQLIAQMFGGRVEPSEKKEYGATHVTVDKAVGVLKGLGEEELVWMSHGDTVYDLPSEFEILAHTENSPIAAFYEDKRSIYGLQWHPEVSHTKKGSLMLRNFIFSVCRCKANWVMGNFIERTVSE
jgi:GMP synthase (glutamine-hydrolysing)